MLERDIANHDVVAVVARPEDILYDTFTGREILVDYNRNVAVICEESADTIVVVSFDENGKVAQIQVLDASKKGCKQFSILARFGSI